MTVPSGIVLVTGASGFIGRHVTARLLAAGHHVRALVRPGRSLPGVELATAELDDPLALSSGLAGVDAVVHLAARVHLTRDAAADPLAEYRRVNVAGTRTLTRLAVAAGVRHVVLMSSVKAMGETNSKPWTARAEPAPADPYGVSKLEAEAVVRELTTGTATLASILRLPLVYGPGQRANVQHLFTLVDRGIPLPLGGIENRRSLAFVGNVAGAVEALLDGRERGVGTWYASDGEDVSTPELVARIARALDRPVRLLHIPARLFQLCGRMGDVFDRVLPVPLTTAAVHRLFGSLVVDSAPLWGLRGGAPPFSMARGLAETATWYRYRTRDRRMPEREHYV